MQLTPIADTESGVHANIQDHPQPTSTSCAFPPVIVRDWYRASVLRLLLAEFCNLCHRIAALREIAAWERRGYMAPRPTKLAPTSVGGPRKRDYILYMQQLQAQHPFLTIVDHYLVSEAWKAGSEWADHTGTSQTQKESERCSQIATSDGLST